MKCRIVHNVYVQTATFEFGLSVGLSNDMRGSLKSEREISSSAGSLSRREIPSGENPCKKLRAPIHTAVQQRNTSSNKEVIIMDCGKKTSSVSTALMFAIICSAANSNASNKNGSGVVGAKCPVKV